MITLRSIYEGNAPHMLFWKLGRFTQYEWPGPEDFSIVNGRRVLRGGNARNLEKPFASRRAPWLRIGYGNVRFSHVREDETDRFRWETQHGTLTARRRDNHMIEFPIKSVDDIPLWQHIQENLVYGSNPDFSKEQREATWSMQWSWSPVQELLQFETGVENFYYFLMDAPERMKSLMETMHRKNLEGLAIGFEACPKATVFRLGENTSSQIISPDYYRELTVPHVATYVDMAHERGMRCVVHMCGHLTSLLDAFKETGMDGIHSVTPPPVGDTPYMAVRERMGDDFIVLGRFSAQLFINRDRDSILGSLEQLIPERLIHTPFALEVFTDQMNPSEEDVRALIGALNELGGRYGDSANRQPC